jgi:hypothetical protein
MYCCKLFQNVSVSFSDHRITEYMRWIHDNSYGFVRGNATFMEDMLVFVPQTFLWLKAETGFLHTAQQKFQCIEKSQETRENLRHVSFANERISEIRDFEDSTEVLLFQWQIDCPWHHPQATFLPETYHFTVKLNKMLHRWNSQI